MQLFPEEEQTPVTAPGQTHATGILPAHGIRNMIRDQQIWAVNGQKSGVLDDQIQPASLICGWVTRPIGSEQVFCLVSQVR